MFMNNMFSQSKVIQFKKPLHKLFELSILWKAVEGLFEGLAGLFAWFVPTQTVINWLQWSEWRELQEDPDDLVANFVHNLSFHISSQVKFLVALYLLAQGLMKLWLSFSVWRGRLWAYLGYEIFISLIIVYELFRWVRRPGWWLIIFIIIDAVTVWLIHHEYQNKKFSA